MPKMKSNSAASKRIRVTGSGKLMQAGSAMRHNLEHKSSRRTRRLSADQPVDAANLKSVKRLLGR